MKSTLIILFFVLVVMVDEANAARRYNPYWGWGNYQRAYRVKKPRPPPRTIVKERTKVVVVDCKDIVDAVRALEPDRLEKTLRKTTERQRQIIRQCTEQTNDDFLRFFRPPR